jgi:hypothetical protein
VIDATSSTFMVSYDGRTWRRLARLGLADMTVSPSDPAIVIATAEQGLLRSADRGRTSTPVTRRAHVRRLARRRVLRPRRCRRGLGEPDGGTTWQRRGELGSQPSAPTVTEAGQLFAANEEAVVTSRDGGRTFSTVTSYTTVAHG